MVDRRGVARPFPLRILLAAALLLMAWRVLSLGMADATARLNPEQALQWRTHHPQALYLLSERQVKTPGTHAAARENAIASLRAYPFNGRAYRVLAQIAQSEKKPQMAYGLYQKAELYSPRDLETRAALLNRALLANNAQSAIDQIDMLLRLQPALQSQLMPVIGQLAAIPAAHDPLIFAVNKNPPWRLPVLNTLLSQEKAAERYALFFNRLAQSKRGLSDAEQKAWLGALNQSKQWPLAYLSWALNLPPERQQELGNIFNGSFENEPIGSEFDWRFDPVPGAVIDRQFRAGAKGKKALLVQFSDRRVPFSHVRQTLVLTSGNYQFSGQGLPENLVTERGLVWEIQCLGGGPSLVTTDTWQGNSQQWRRFSTAFEVPAASCTAQTITLKLPARVPVEQQISGAIWFDDLRIQKIQRLIEPAVQ